ncbi:MAG: hypothetical protein M1823_006884 [Watsoniomyces obsoletus]|nr:MAG: hypothetical protein M1823_006884 [Watsoniomyces obsoletus]
MFTLDLEAMRVAHAVMASACMLIFFPFGGVILRIVSVDNHPHIVWFHAGVQMFAYTLFLAAAGVGIWMAKNYGVIGGYHPIVGMCILVGMSFQPVTEILNHFFYARYPKILYLGYVHLWLGRVLITLGMINGGLGFAFADTIPYQPVWSVAPKIVYAIIAGVVWIMYFLFCGVWQQVKYVRRMSHPGTGGEEMENLRGREGARAEQNVEAGNGSKLNVAEGDGRRRKVSPLPMQGGVRSSAL